MELTNFDSKEYSELLELQKKVKARVDEMESDVKRQMGDDEIATCEDWMFTWKNGTSKRLDGTRLKKEDPTTWEKFSKITESRTFRKSIKKD